MKFETEASSVEAAPALVGVKVSLDRNDPLSFFVGEHITSADRLSLNHTFHLVLARFIPRDLSRWYPTSIPTKSITRNLLS